MASLWRVNPSGRLSAGDLVRKASGDGASSLIAAEFLVIVPVIAAVESATADTVAMSGSAPVTDTLFDTLTALVVPFDGGFVDGKGHLLTAGGTAAIAATPSQWGGGAGYFDGATGTVVTSPNSGTLDNNNQDYCIECWVWLPTGSSGGQIIRYGKATGYTNYAVKITAAGVINVAYGNATTSQSLDFSDPAGIPRDQWVFIKVGRTGSSVQCWVNGINYYAAFTATVNTGIIPAATLCIGNSHENNLPLNAYLDDLRVTIGDSRPATDTAIPTTPFQSAAIILPRSGSLSATEIGVDTFFATPLQGGPLAAVEAATDTASLAGQLTDEFIANTQLLVHFDGAFVDGIGHALSVNGATLSTAQSKWGGSSGYFNGAAALTSPNSASLDVGATVDFCLECWVWLPTGSSGGQIIRYGKVSNFINWGLSINASGVVVLEDGNSGSSSNWQLSNPAGIPRDQWVFIRASKTGTAVQAWVNGASYYTAGTITVDTGVIAGASLFIGRTPESTGYFNGYLDDLRVTIGNSRSATNTVVPTSAFPNPVTPSSVGDLAAIESVSDTLAMSGYADVAGGLDAVEMAADTGALTGSHDVAGALVAVEPATDGVALSGVVPVSGAVSAAEADQDASALWGEVGVSGALFANETAADGAGWSGAVSVVGSMVLTEIDIDSLAASGFLTVINASTGPLTATETGLLDEAAVVGAVAVSGAVSADEPADGVAVVGVVVSAGTLQSLETAVDVAEFFGSQDITGLLDSVEAAGDSLSATVEVAVIGTVAVIETGFDVPDFAGLRYATGDIQGVEEPVPDAASAWGYAVRVISGSWATYVEFFGRPGDTEFINSIDGKPLLKETSGTPRPTAPAPSVSSDLAMDGHTYGSFYGDCNTFYQLDSSGIAGGRPYNGYVLEFWFKLDAFGYYLHRSSSGYPDTWTWTDITPVDVAAETVPSGNWASDLTLLGDSGSLGIGINPVLSGGYRFWVQTIGSALFDSATYVRGITAGGIDVRLGVWHHLVLDNSNANTVPAKIIFDGQELAMTMPVYTGAAGFQIYPAIMSLFSAPYTNPGFVGSLAQIKLGGGPYTNNGIPKFAALSATESGATITTYYMRGWDSSGQFVYWSSVGTPDIVPAVTKPPLMGMLTSIELVGEM